LFFRIDLGPLCLLWYEDPLDFDLDLEVDFYLCPYDDLADLLGCEI